MMHNNSKFGNTMFSGLEDIIWININFSTFRCDLNPEFTNPFFFSQDTLASDGVSSDQVLASDGVSSDQVWLPRSQQFR